MSDNFRLRPITPRTEQGKAAREQALADMSKRREDERSIMTFATSRAPVTPRSGESKARYMANLKARIARSENLVRAEKEQSGQNEECTGQGCIGKLKSGLSRISKAVGLSGGRKHTMRRKTRRSGRKTRHSRR